ILSNIINNKNKKMERQLLIDEMQSYLQDVMVKLDANGAAENYNGFYLWGSKYVQNPDIMFIGINPGAGDEGRKVNRRIDLEPRQMHNYVEYPKYEIADQTRKMLSSLNISD